MKLVVVGGSGFTGGHVVAQAVAGGDEVVVVCRSDRAAEKVRRLGAHPVPGDLDRPASLAGALSHGHDCLVTIASLGFGHAPVLVAAAEASGVRRAVFVSTTAVTTSLPAASKRVRLEAEAVVRSSNLDWTLLRPTMIYGSREDRNLWRLLQLLRRTPVLPLPGGGRRLQQPVHVEDLAGALLSAAHRPDSAGKTYDVAGPQPVTLRELVQEAGAAVGRSPRLVPVPLQPLIPLVRTYERLVRRPRLKAEQLERLAEDKSFSIVDARRDLDFQPRSFREGIRCEAAGMTS